MSTITREQLRARAREKVKSLEFSITQTAFADSRAELEEELELARIALASLEAEPAIHRWRRVTAEPYGPYPWHYGDFIGFSKPVDGIEDEYFYSAPPEPSNAEPVAWLWSHRKHPSEVSLVRPEDDERAEGAHWSGWSCQALYAAPPAPVSVPEWTNEQCLEFLSIAFRHAEIKGDLELDDIRLGVKMVNGSRAAMLQGAEPVTTAYKLRDAVEIIRNSGIEIDSGKIQAERDSLNSPVIPDCSCRTCRPVTFSDSRFVVCPECGNKRCPHANDHRNACTGSNEPGQEGSAYPAAPQQEVK
ncbi:TPA: hypothetical protein ACIAH4_002612 [Enterobacter roggenkampii]